MRYSLILTLVLLTLREKAGTAATQGDWPQFRGPNASGVSEKSKPPARFGPGDHELWSVEVPWSPSSPAIMDGRLFLTTFHDNQLETRCYDRSSGALKWVKGVKPAQLEAFHSTDGSPAASTPAVQGNRVVSYFGSFGLVCHDLEGNEIWRRPLPVAMSGGNYGSGTSPVIIGKRVFLNRDQDVNSSVMAVEIETGTNAWESPRPEASGGFGTPIHWSNQGAEELIVAGSSTVKAYDVATGRERWNVDGVASFICTTPVLGDGLLYFGAWSQGKADSSFPLEWPAFLARFDQNHDGKVDASDFDKVMWDFMRGIDRNRDGSITSVDLDIIQAGSAKGDNLLLAIRPGGNGNISATHVAWKFGRGLPYVPSPLHYDGRIYLVKDGGLLSSIDARTGAPVYVQERLDAPGGYYASPVAADGRIYLASLPGKLTVVRAGGDTPTVLHQVDFKERILATPALVEDKIYLRTQTRLYAFGAARGG